MKKAKVESEIERLYHEIEVLDNKYHFSKDDVEVDEKLLDMISKKIERLEMLQRIVV